MKLRYIRGKREVEIAVTRQRVGRGQTVTVPDALGLRLLREQPRFWERVKVVPKKRVEVSPPPVPKSRGG